KGELTLPTAGRGIASTHHQIDPADRKGQGSEASRDRVTVARLGGGLNLGHTRSVRLCARRAALGGRQGSAVTTRVRAAGRIAIRVSHTREQILAELVPRPTRGGAVGCRRRVVQAITHQQVVVGVALTVLLLARAAARRIDARRRTSVPARRITVVALLARIARLVAAEAAIARTGRAARSGRAAGRSAGSAR